MTNKPNIANPYEGLTEQEALEEMLQLVNGQTRNYMRMGLLYNYLVDSKLLEGSKEYKSPLDYLCNNVKEVSRTSLLDYSAVARVFREEVGARYGMSRLRLLLSYKEATKLEVDYEEPGTALIQVPDKKGKVEPKLFADCSTEELRQALKLVRAEPESKPYPEQERTLVDGYREAIMRHLPQGTPVRVQLNRHKEESVMEIRTIPLGQVDKLIEGLMSQYSVMGAGVGVKRAEKVRLS
ncbi:hypothetical protein [Hyalangium versicolor]|uniref:hypothetical protein n=1 Tax=Hyalangium versicolor TaxID=2861190 RepID=UPI001CCA48C3|nr:hypothetical protein [Hyalangium versicolor]